VPQDRVEDEHDGSSLPRVGGYGLGEQISIVEFDGRSSRKRAPRINAGNEVVTRAQSDYHAAMIANNAAAMARLRRSPLVRL
jgi:hypothetical protein